MQSACMVALQIRDVPPAVRDALAHEARRRGQSLQGYLLNVVEAEAARSRNIDIISTVVDLGSGLTGDVDPVEVLHSARADHANRLTQRS